MAHIFPVQQGRLLPAEPGVHIDVAIAELAAAQHGVISRTQMLHMGASKAAIDHRIAVRRLQPIHAGVYAVGHATPRATGLYVAALLACGPNAVLSHRAAAHHLGLLSADGGPIDVTVPRRGARSRPAIRLHTTRVMHPDDVAIVEGVSCTSTARTLVDLAGLGSRRLLDRALEQSQVLRVFDLRSIEAALCRASGRRGGRLLRQRLAELADTPAPLRSELERRFLELVVHAGLPSPVVNAVVAGHAVDFHWPAQRLVAETDGRATHDTAYGFERDRRRDLDLGLAGWHVVRFTWRQLVDEPGRVTALLRGRLPIQR